MDCYFELRFQGRWASSNQIEFYDVAQALVGFERVISLTNHLLLNGDVITQSPSATGFRLVALPAEEGSWKWTIGLALGFGQLVHTFGTAPPDTAFGWLSKAAVEYVIQESLGFTPNFDETLAPQIERYRRQSPKQRIDGNLSIDRFDSLIEKTESGLKSVHRPIMFSQSAEVANFSWRSGSTEKPIEAYASKDTFDYVDRIITSEDFSDYTGDISSYNSNTYKGRMYVPKLERTVPFELSEDCRTTSNIRTITQSLSDNAVTRTRGSAPATHITFQALRNETPSGRLKSIYIVSVAKHF